jgi:hypothetical protein
MWTVIYIAQSGKVADQIKDRLAEEGFFPKIRQTSVSKQYEILVPESELDEVQEVLKDILHSAHN